MATKTLGGGQGRQPAAEALEAYKGRMTEPQHKSCLPHCRAEEVKGGGGLLAHGHALLVVCLPRIQLFQGEVPALHWQTS